MINKDNIEVLSLFPTPVFTTVYTKGDLDDTIDFLDNSKMNSDGKPDQYGLVSEDTYILDSKECKPLADFIMDAVLVFGKEIMMYDYDEYKFSQSWISHKKSGQIHTAHTHSNSLISGVFYYGEEDPNMPAITFHKWYGAINISQLSPIYKKDRRPSQYAWDTFSINYSAGLLLLFPSYLLHSVPVNNTKKVRKSIAFNILPKEKIGDERSLNEILFKRLI